MKELRIMPRGITEEDEEGNIHHFIKYGVEMEVPDGSLAVLLFDTKDEALAFLKGHSLGFGMGQAEALKTVNGLFKDGRDV